MGWGELPKNFKPRWLRIGVVIAIFTFSAFVESRNDEHWIDRTLIAAIATHEKLMSTVGKEDGLEEYKNDIHLHAREPIVVKIMQNWVLLFLLFMLVCHRDRVVHFFAIPVTDDFGDEAYAESEPSASPAGV